MSTDTSAKTTSSKASVPRRRIWICAFIVVLALISFGYLSFINSRGNFANSDFYRVLYEASNKFNENLSQLDKMHVNEESINSIRAQLPSYQRKQTNDAQNINKSFNYSLSGHNILIKNGNFDAEVRVADILPSPKQGFSQYLFANSEGKVLATIGGEKTISIDNLTSINKEIEKSKHRYQFNLKEPESSDGDDGRQHLPSYSSHVDMKLSYGEFRIFIFPFSLDTALSTKPNNQKQESSNNASPTGTINTLYLVGLLPKHKLHIEDSGYWSLSLLLVTLVSLLFIWTLLRLYLLPKSQSITPLYRNFTMLSSYGFFIVLIALVLAFMQKTTLQMSKDREAVAYAKKLYTQLNGDLIKVFQGLDNYRPFYHNLLAELDDFATLNAPNGTESNNNVSATDRFSQMIENSLVSLTSPSCKPLSEKKLPGYAFTPRKAYLITSNCLVDTNGEENWQVTAKLDQSAEQILLQAQQKNVSGEAVLSFMASNLDLKVESNGMVESHIGQGKQGYLPANILTVFAINDEGNTTLPPIYYQESNAPPQVVNLIERDYYKKIRDYQGWQLCLAAEKNNSDQCVEFNNVYLQRLLNISDGTRGTTISMPMYDPKDSVLPGSGLTAYILGADVILPSLSLAAPAPYDFTYMVIDRDSGGVLFHSNESRALVENLFYSGNNKSNLSQWIKARLDYYPELSEEIIEGHYHGQSGRFVLIPAPIDAWAIVIFYPNDSLDALMANQFLLISVSFAFALLVLVGLLTVCRKFSYTNILKNELFIRAGINGRIIIMAGSIMFSAIYSLYYIGLLFDLAEFWQQSVRMFSWILPSAGVLILLFYLFRICNKRLSAAGSSSHMSTNKSLKALFAVAILLSMTHLYYLHAAAQMPLKALGFHYQQVHCNWLNYERQEMIKMALSRYPNSITQQRIDPITLLPLTSQLENNLKDKITCQMHSSQVEPDDYLNLSSLVGATYLWQWINAYFTTGFPTAAPPTIQEDLKILWPVAGYSILIGIIIWIWLGFNRRMLWTRLYYSDGFLQHIERLTKSKSTLKQGSHHTKLIIECDRVKLNGIGLALLLRTTVMHESKSTEPKLNNLLVGFDTLYQLSPCLQRLGASNSFLPNLKLNVIEDADSKKLDVQIWDIETCLEQAQFRQHLLDLIMEIKSLTLANQLNSFTIFTGYHSLQRVKMKDPLLVEESSILEHAEYLSWAECLMDFNVKVTDILERGVDKRLLEQEISDFPELFFLSSDALESSETTEKSLWDQGEDSRIGAQWTTINYILLRAEALYRFKWESCSNAEKLALLSLDRQHRINPSNTQMIEHLAVNGLIKVKQGHLEIANNSFAYFIRNAETIDTVNRLVSQSEAGFWKDYQLPLGLLVILIIGGIALTSGESIYIIAASVAGVIGTIASIATSASMLRGQFKE
ncbi:hypothetical protein SAMN05216419_10054 [Nitrosomonas cryotolerans]|uniref:Cache domain-containing protein n=1 Tax=Nitrosomonas cryotolerans ATCC 49181 TaxID=1131553 RepID=A0A1N6G9N5_9PROT|nr:hypothetical protein [Nitrosomonas cryotolerans]SFP51075.1 hypothetical protein SAMN05216419_10054 [Nitrosomonas cryotolerans]SIO04132.1 hypothetical protein SAMN02743940_0610 [Nitrosomonas cryotolerans ATCC 49181]